MDDEPGMIGACLEGDTGALRTLVDRHAPAVRGFLLRKLGDPERAEEAAQESFVRAFAGLAALKDRERFVSWVLGIAAKVALEESRRADRRAGGESPEVAGPPASSEGKPGEELARVVATLPEPYRGAVWLRYWAGMSCAAAAEAQGVSVGTFTKRLTRAHAMVRDRISGASDEVHRKERVHELRRVP